MSRLVDFDHILNFRDFGDYPVAGGARLKKGMLFRSGHHAHASDADLLNLASLNLGLIADLRRPDERRKDPCRRPSPFSASLIETGDDCTAEPPFLSLLGDPGVSEETIRHFMARRYGVYPFDSGISGVYRRFIQSLASAKGPVLAHCAAGKDRTGVLVALTHHLLGVHTDDALEDYLMTNRCNRIDSRKAEIAETVMRSYNVAVPERLILMIANVEAVYLDHAFAAIGERYPSVDSYIQDYLGVSSKQKDKIREKFIA